MMKRVLIYGVLFWVLGCYKAAGQEAIGLYDLHYTLETDLSTPKGRNVAWDDVHVVSACKESSIGMLRNYMSFLWIGINWILINIG